MTRLSFDHSIPLQPLDTLSASGPLSEAATHSPGSFNDLLHQAAEAAHAAPREPSGEPARSASLKTPPAATKPAGAPSPRSDQAGVSQASSASPPRATPDASPPSGNSTDRPSDTTADGGRGTGDGGQGTGDGGRETADAPAGDQGRQRIPGKEKPTTQETPNSVAASLAAVGIQAAAAPPASAPTGTPETRPGAGLPGSTPGATAGKDHGAAKADRSSAGVPGLAAPANPAAVANTAGAAARANTIGAPSLAPKTADGQPPDATTKTASAMAGKDPAATIAQNLSEASGPPSPSQGTAAPAATASTQAAVQNGDPQAAAQAVQAANTGMAAADGAAGARQPAIGDAAPSVAGSLAGNGASAAGDAGPDRSQYLGRAAGKSVAGRRGNAVVASMTASDDSTAQTAGSVESTLTGRAGDQENQPGNANPAGPSLAKATTFDLPTAANPAKSDAAAVAVKSNALPTTAQAQGTGPAQGPSSLGAPAASATGQAAAGAPAASATGQAAPSASQADRVRLVERVAAAFEAAGDQGGTVRLRLHPPELGAVKVEVNVRNGVMNAHLETETSAARSLLLDNLPALRDRLAQQQIKVERFDVDLAGQSSGGTPQDAHQQARQQSQPYSTAKQNRPGGPQAAESAAALPAVRTAARGRFDVTI